ncbi:MAG: DUF3047 domain-containing protein [Burkholderiales bacterium]|nr:MAG: DUF3047 domain-containing protein [Burkholderiales bacterium]
MTAPAGPPQGRASPTPERAQPANGTHPLPQDGGRGAGTPVSRETPPGRRNLAVAAATAVAVLLAACSATPPRAPGTESCQLAPFSAALPGSAWPPGWEPWTLSTMKRPTDYRLIAGDTNTVVEAKADRSASGLVHKLDVPVSACRAIRWRWKVVNAIAHADPRQANLDDSPARVIVVFDGDRKRFDFDDRLFSARIKAFTGQELPYATLIYAWQPALPPDSVVKSPHTGRIRTLALGGDQGAAGRWLEIQRDLQEDFRRAFGEEPGRIRSVALMTDADNTGREAAAHYGDIVLQPRRER